MATYNWEELIADKKRRQLESIPKEWIVSVPAEEVLDVTKYPEEWAIVCYRYTDHKYWCRWFIEETCRGAMVLRGGDHSVLQKSNHCASTSK
jgi:hypothetical protein